MAVLRRILYSKEVGTFSLLIVCMVALYAFAWRDMRFFMVPSGSMNPTLHPGDMLVTLNAVRYERGDIVVWREQDEYVVKRIIGLPGDNISVIDGALFINGKYASEPYTKDPMRYYIERPVRVPENRFFYLGDNRNASDDSSIGFIVHDGPRQNIDPATYFGDMEEIIGRARFIYFPYDRLGRVLSYPLTNTAGQ